VHVLRRASPFLEAKMEKAGMTGVPATRRRNENGDQDFFRFSVTFCNTALHWAAFELLRGGSRGCRRAVRQNAGPRGGRLSLPKARIARRRQEFGGPFAVWRLFSMGAGGRELRHRRPADLGFAGVSE